MRKPQYVLLFMNIFSEMAYSIISPLFPSVADKLGVNEDILGYIMNYDLYINHIIKMEY